MSLIPCRSLPEDAPPARAGLSGVGILVGTICPGRDGFVGHLPQHLAKGGEVLLFLGRFFEGLFRFGRRDFLGYLAGGDLLILVRRGLRCRLLLRLVPGFGWGVLRFRPVVVGVLVAGIVQVPRLGALFSLGEGRLDLRRGV